MNHPVKPANRGVRRRATPLIPAALVWLLAVLLPGLAGASIYDVSAVRVQVPDVSQGMDPRTAGLTEARRTAFGQLLRRMLTGSDRQTHREALETLALDDRKLAERTVVRGERRLQGSLLLTVDVTFSAKAVRAALSGLGLTYNETPYPPVLLVVRQGGAIAVPGKTKSLLADTFAQAARDHGFTIVTPLGDVEDLGNLSWERAVAGDRAMLRWATARYGVGRVWALHAGIGAEAPVRPGSGEAVAAAELRVSQRGGGVEATRSQSARHPACEAMGAAARVRACYHARLSTALLRWAMDNWIGAHVVDPSLRHATRLRVIHDMRFPRYERFLSGLRAIPGLSGVRFVWMQAREALLEVDYQGRDDQLIQAISRLDVRMEEGPGNGEGEIRLRLP